MVYLVVFNHAHAVSTLLARLVFFRVCIISSYAFVFFLQRTFMVVLDLEEPSSLRCSSIFFLRSLLNFFIRLTI